MSTRSQKLKTAIHFGDIKKVKELLKSTGKKPVSNDPFIFGGYGLLKLAIGLRQKEIAKLLIKKGARMNKKHNDDISASPLHIAVYQRCTNIIKLLVKKGAAVNDVASGCFTPLMVAIMFLKSRKFLDTQTLEITKCLLNNGADTEGKFSITNYDGSTALDLACIWQNFKCVQLLLKNNATVNSSTLYGSTPIVASILKGSLPIVKLLLNYGAQANSIISENSMELFMNKNSPITERLRSLGNPTLLCYAIICFKEELVELLINYGADVNYRTKSFHRTPLMLAIEEYDPIVVELLLNKGAKIDVYDEEGMSPLHYIICNPKNVDKRLSLEMLQELDYEKLEILRLLIKAGADVNEALKPLGSKLTFLTTAATYGQVAIINYLASSHYLDVSLIDYSILQAAEVNENLLPQEQIDDEGFLKKIVNIYQAVEGNLMELLFTRYFKGIPVKKELIEAVRAKPVNYFWIDYDYLDYVETIQSEICKCRKSMMELRIGASNITMWQLLTSPWNQMIRHAHNKDVRELDIKDYYDECHFYFLELEERINAAVKRSKLLEKSIEIVFSLFETLPFECCETILTNFSDDDLELLNSECDKNNLIESRFNKRQLQEDIEPPAKRMKH